MRIKITTKLNCPAHRVFEEVQTSQLFQYIIHPIASFVPTETSSFPTRWKEGSYNFKIRVFGCIPFGKHSIVISMVHRDENLGTYMIRDNGFGEMIAKWDHLITIKRDDASFTTYIDSIEVKAGFLTPFVWIFALVFYHYRQYRLRKLVTAGFRYPVAGYS